MSVPPNRMQGLLKLLQDPAINQGLLSAGSGLLQSSGYSTMPVSTGQALGAGLQGFMQGKQNATEQAINAALLKKQLEPKPIEDPASVREYEFAKKNGYAGTFEDWKKTGGTQAQPPSAVQEYEYWKALPSKEEKDAYLTIKRSMQPYQLGEVAGGKVVFNRATGQWDQVTDAGQEGAAAGQIAGATAAGKVSGETTATAQFDLPRVEDNAKQTLDLLDKLEKHPGRKAATGASSAIPLDKLPGTDARDFVASLGQLQGKQFLEAYQSLRGGGQITEVEGAKAETAISTLQDRGQSEEAWLQAAKDLREVVNAGLERAKKKAGSSTSAPKLKYNPATGKIE